MPKLLRGSPFWILLNIIFRQNSNCVQIDEVLPFTRPLKRHNFQSASLLTAFSNRLGFGSGLGRHRVNGRRKREKLNGGYVREKIEWWIRLGI